MAGTIGKIVMVGAMAAAFAAPLGLGEAFVLENVRYEMIIAAFLYLFSHHLSYRHLIYQARMALFFHSFPSW